MSKRPDPLETLQISHEILRRIPKGRTVTAPELHQQLADAGFERDMRTIQRQLETLGGLQQFFAAFEGTIKALVLDIDERAALVGIVELPGDIAHLEAHLNPCCFCSPSST